jgi:SAM-dependent methyltransferase
VSASSSHEQFRDLDFDAFQRMADDTSLSPHERSGFPDELRDGAESVILADIVAKLPALAENRATVIDIGCGANPLTDLLIDLCERSEHRLTLVDGPEVLSHHRASPTVSLVAGRFPDTPSVLADLEGRCDAVIAYSVLQYAFTDMGVHDFVDPALKLLAPGGRLLLGDVPNASMRRRFLASDTGREHHRTYVGRDEDPPVAWPTLPIGEIDDAVIFGLLARARDAGFHAWLVPQDADLPMANRREDLICERP